MDYEDLDILDDEPDDPDDPSIDLPIYIRRARAASGLQRRRAGWLRWAFGFAEIFDLRHDVVEIAMLPGGLIIDEPEFNDQDTRTIFLTFTRGGRKFSINLSSFTEDELLYFETFITHAIALARPVCQARDRKARHAQEDGNTDYGRGYRLLPEFIIRERVRREYGKGVPIGPPDILGGRIPSVDGGEPEPDLTKAAPRKRKPASPAPERVRKVSNKVDRTEPRPSVPKDSGPAPRVSAGLSEISFPVPPPVQLPPPPLPPA